MPAYGSYECVDLRHRGGDSTVWSARRAAGPGEKTPAAEARFAVKVFRPSDLLDAEQAEAQRRHFLASADLQRRLADDCPAWAPIHERGQAEDQGGDGEPAGDRPPAAVAYSVSDLAGGTLQDIVNQRRAVDARDLHHIFAAIVEALCALEEHAARPHGNLRASNVLLDRRAMRRPGRGGRGSVRVADPLPPPALQASGKTHAADLRDLGLLLYQLVVHREWDRRRGQTPEFSRHWERPSRAGGEWHRICCRLLGLNPGTLEQLRRDLQPLALRRRLPWLPLPDLSWRRRPLPARPRTPSRPDRPRLPRPGRRTLAAAGGMVLLGALSIAAYFGVVRYIENRAVAQWHALRDAACEWKWLWSEGGDEESGKFDQFVTELLDRLRWEDVDPGRFIDIAENEDVCEVDREIPAGQRAALRGSIANIRQANRRLDGLRERWDGQLTEWREARDNLRNNDLDRIAKVIDKGVKAFERARPEKARDEIASEYRELDTLINLVSDLSEDLGRETWNDLRDGIRGCVVTEEPVPIQVIIAALENIKNNMECYRGRADWIEQQQQKIVDGIDVVEERRRELSSKQAALNKEIKALCCGENWKEDRERIQQVVATLRRDADPSYHKRQATTFLNRKRDEDPPEDIEKQWWFDLISRVEEKGPSSQVEARRWLDAVLQHVTDLRKEMTLDDGWADTLRESAEEKRVEFVEQAIDDAPVVCDDGEWRQKHAETWTEWRADVNRVATNLERATELIDAWRGYDELVNEQSVKGLYESAKDWDVWEDVQEAFRKKTGRIDALEAVSKESVDELVGLLADDDNDSYDSALAFAAWKRLADDGGPSPPLDQLGLLQGVQDRLRRAVPDHRTDDIDMGERSRAVWRRAVLSVTEEEQMADWLGARKDFEIDESYEGTLAGSENERDRRLSANIRLHRIKAAVGEGDGAAIEEIGDNVKTDLVWLADRYADAENGVLEDLVKAWNAYKNTQNGSGFEDFGPGSRADWSFDEQLSGTDREWVTYVWRRGGDAMPDAGGGANGAAGGEVEQGAAEQGAGETGEHRITFRRVEVTGEDGSTRLSYLATSEFPLGLFIDVVNEYGDWNVLLGDQGLMVPSKRGPRAWTELPNGEVAGRWIGQSDGLVDSNFNSLNEPRKMPMQHVSVAAAMYVARLLNCRLPTVEEWNAAKRMDGSGSASPRLPGGAFRRQLDHYRNQRLGEARVNPRDGAFRLPDVGSRTAAIKDETNDSDDAQEEEDILYFRAVDPASTEFTDLVGNVWEFVLSREAADRLRGYDEGDGPVDARGIRDLAKDIARAGDGGTGAGNGTEGWPGLLIIGRSALSDWAAEDDGGPSYPADRWGNREDGPLREGHWLTHTWADVGFRLAFSAEGLLDRRRLDKAIRTAIKDADYIYNDPEPGAAAAADGV